MKVFYKMKKLPLFYVIMVRKNKEHHCLIWCISHVNVLVKRYKIQVTVFLTYKTSPRFRIGYREYFTVYCIRYTVQTYKSLQKKVQNTYVPVNYCFYVFWFSGQSVIAYRHVITRFFITYTCCTILRPLKYQRSHFYDSRKINFRP